MCKQFLYFFFLFLKIVDKTILTNSRFKFKSNSLFIKLICGISSANVFEHICYVFNFLTEKQASKSLFCSLSLLNCWKYREYIVASNLNYKYQKIDITSSISIYKNKRNDQLSDTFIDYIQIDNST